MVKDTLAVLRAAGKRSRECGVLWLGTRKGDRVRIKEAYRPEQYTESRMFYYPPSSMAALRQKLVQERYMIGAQVHSHPREAYHSLADDGGAIVGHRGALSLVVPDFGLRTQLTSFLVDTKVYRLSGENRWIEVAEAELHECLRID